MRRGLVYVLGLFGSGVVFCGLTAAVGAQQPGSVRVPGAHPSVAKATAFVDVTVIPMDTERVLPNQTVLVEGGQITALGPVSKVKVPVGAVRIDGRGKYLIPGLADMHVHLRVLGTDSTWRERQFASFLANGVTTIRSMDGDASTLRLRAEAAAGIHLSPRIYTSGPWAPVSYTGSAADRSPSPRLDSVAAYVAAYQALGYDHIKPYFERRPVFDSMLAAARRLGMPVAGHVPQPWTGKTDSTLSLELVLSSGAYRSIEHLMGYTDQISSPMSLPYLDQAAAAKLPMRAAATARAGVWNTPTLAVLSERYRLDPKQWEGGRRAYADANQRIVRALHEAGAGLLLGSDITDLFAQWGTPNLVHHELAALVRAGLTPYEALLTGTRNVAAYFGTLHESGTIAVGKRADLVLVSSNPLERLSSIREPVGVVLGGRWLDRAELDRRLFPSKANVLTWYAYDVSSGFSPSLSDSQAKAQTGPQARLKALADSLVAAPVAGGNQRLQILGRMAEEFGAIRAVLLPEQREGFDPPVRAWLREQARQGGELP